LHITKITLTKVAHFFKGLLSCVIAGSYIKWH